MQSVRGFHRVVGGMLKRQRECCDGTLTCKLPGCPEPSVGYIVTVTGPQPVCEKHAPGAERAGYVVHRADGSRP